MQPVLVCGGTMGEALHEDGVALGLFGQGVEVGGFARGVVALAEDSDADKAGDLGCGEADVACAAG